MTPNGTTCSLILAQTYSLSNRCVLTNGSLRQDRTYTHLQWQCNYYITKLCNLQKKKREREKKSEGDNRRRSKRENIRMKHVQEYRKSYNFEHVSVCFSTCWFSSVAHTWRVFQCFVLFISLCVSSKNTLHKRVKLKKMLKRLIFLRHLL